MKTFTLTISSPDGELYRGEARMVILRGTEGELAIMADHVPFVTGIVKGRCVVISGAEQRKEGTIEEGILTVGAKEVTVLTSGLEWQKGD